MLDYAVGSAAMDFSMVLLLIHWLLSSLCTAVAFAAARCWRKRPWYVVFMAVFIIFLLAGFNLEGNVLTADEVPSEAAQKWVEQVEEEQRTIESLPYVQHVAFHYGPTHNDCKVLATLWCCWEPSRRSFKQVPVHCHITHRPTHLEALQQLREKLVHEHGDADHTPHAKAVERRQQLHGSSTTTRPQATIFDRMKAAACAQSLADQRAAADARALAQKDAALLNATREREAAAARAKASQEAASALAPPNARKRQKAAASVAGSGEGSAEQVRASPPSLAT